LKNAEENNETNRYAQAEDKLKQK